MYFIELWLIFRKFRSYERSELQVHRIAQQYSKYNYNLDLIEMMRGKSVFFISYIAFFIVSIYISYCVHILLYISS